MQISSTNVSSPYEAAFHAADGVRGFCVTTDSGFHWKLHFPVITKRPPKIATNILHAFQHRYITKTSSLLAADPFWHIIHLYVPLVWFLISDF